MRLSTAIAGFATCVALAGCHNGWHASSTAFGTRDALKPLIRSAPTPGGGTLEFELREPAYAYVFSIVSSFGDERAVLIDGISHEILKAGSHQMALGGVPGRVSPVIDVAAGAAAGSPRALLAGATGQDVPSTSVAMPTAAPGSAVPFACITSLPIYPTTAPGTTAGQALQWSINTAGEGLRGSCAASHLRGRSAVGDERRLVVVVRTSRANASDLLLPLDISRMASDAEIIDALRKSLDAPGAESGDWGAVAVLVAAERVPTKSALP